MKKLFVKIAFAVAGFTGVASAQQDPQFTQFMYNKLIYNPGYAGTTGAICGVLQYRKQWVGFTGAPTTFALAADMRLKALPIGLGLTVISDKIGPMTTNYLRLAGSFNKKLGAGTLGIGIDAGFLQKTISSNWVVPEPYAVDNSIPGAAGFDPTGATLYNNGSLNKLTYDLGLGVFYNIPGKAYVGLSATHLPSQVVKGNGEIKFQEKAHYYLMAGYTFQLNKWSKITPNVLYKNDLASSALDANLTYLWSDMIWIGGTYRVNDAAAVLAGFQRTALKGNSLSYKVGLSYDFTTPKLKTYSTGSVEFIVGVCFTPIPKTKTSYRNDRFLE